MSRVKFFPISFQFLRKLKDIESVQLDHAELSSHPTEATHNIVPDTVQSYIHDEVDGEASPSLLLHSLTAPLVNLYRLSIRELMSLATADWD